MVQLHFLSNFLQRRITVSTEAPTGLIPALEEHGLHHRGPDVHLLRVPSVIESDEPVARYSHIVPLVKTRMLEELSVCGMVELKQCAADWDMEATLKCCECGQKYHPSCMGVINVEENFKCGCTRTSFRVKE